MLSDPLVAAGAVFALFGLLFLVIAVVVLKRRKLIGGTPSLVLALLMLSLAALSGTISIAVQGYSAEARPAGEF